MAVTLQQLTDIQYDILREEENVSAYPLVFMQQLANTAQLRICSGTLKNPINWMVVRRGRLPFLQTTQFYKSVQSTSLSTASSAWDATLTVADTSNYPSTWSLYIEWDIATYTGTTATTFTWVTGLLTDHKAGKRVRVAHTMPSDYMSAINVIYANWGQLEQRNYDDMFEQENDYKGRRNISRDWMDVLYEGIPFYTIIDSQYLVIFWLERSWDNIMLRYEKLPTSMDTAESTATIDSDIFVKATIPYIAVWEMLYNRGEEQRGAELINFGMGQVKEMYEYYNKRDTQRISGTKYRTSKWWYNI